ncbi:uncharacterized protein V1518DRAFT_408460 [Limtongia smithiae]|uniref:uncharacterized protein n=1 Tax=Limtongia smithiae TaxID=1125753 RepID=UPI0034CD6FDC
MPPADPAAAPAVVPLQQRLLKLAKSLQFAWFSGHVLVLTGTFFYALSAVRFASASRWAVFWYREAFLSVVATYGIVLFRSYKAAAPTATTLIRDDNVQYLAIALLWLISRPLFVTLPPFAIYSFFHVLTYVRTNVLPTIGQPPNAPLAVKIQAFVDNYNDKFTALVANLELVLLMRLFLTALAFRRGSWISLLVYGSFIRLRFEQSVFTKQAVHNWEVRVDGLIAHPKVPVPVKTGWAKVKTAMKQSAAPRAAAKAE